jgi:hypothetical protein
MNNNRPGVFRVRSAFAHRLLGVAIPNTTTKPKKSSKSNNDPVRNMIRNDFKPKIIFDSDDDVEDEEDEEEEEVVQFPKSNVDNKKNFFGVRRTLGGIADSL